MSWTLTEDVSSVAGEQPFFRVTDEHGLLIAELSPLTADETDYRRECLRMMMAAPDLLASLKEIYHWARFKDSTWAIQAAKAIELAEGK